MGAKQITFLNTEGKRLAALLNLPAGHPKAYALFAHCFTCGKDIPAARIIAETLASHGIGVLRFDFAGLGGSEGDFADTNFSSNTDDLIAAANYLRRTAKAPTLLIGHSLGGAAVLAAAPRLSDVKAVVTIGAPCDPSHVTNLFANQVATIRDRGALTVTLAGRPFTIKQQFLDDISEQKLVAIIPQLRKALLVMHAPTDQIVGIENASYIFRLARHPKSFVSLDRADHLLKRRADAEFAANMLAVWAMRHTVDDSYTVPRDEPVIVSETHVGRFQQSLALGRHHLLADEPATVGGLGTGPSPYDFLLGSLGACTAMTIRLYADRKQFPLDHVAVKLKHSRVHARDGQAVCEGEPAGLERIDRRITLEGNLSLGQRAELLEIADRCPIHRTLTSSLEMRTAADGALPIKQDR
ncbi:MAG: OsmC family protein [Alphaproteobacteria bacterium]|nr:OsmC family protein [Alphaproteobacteria bacterium]